MTELELFLKEKEVLKKGLLQFRPFDEHVRIALIKNEIIFGAAKNFNDPFDCNLPIDFENSSLENIIEYLKIADKRNSLTEAELIEEAKFYFENKTEFEKRLRRLIYDYRRFSCFQVDKRENSHKNISFWANYADKNKGICMKFNGEIIYAGRHFLINETERINSIPIEYIDTIPEFDYIKNRIKKSEIKDNQAEQNEFLASKYFMGYKSKEWKKEKEVRFVYTSLVNPFLEPYVNLKFKPKMLEQVYIGCKANEEDILRIFHLPKYDHVAVYKLIMDKKHFRFNEVRLK